ncbi:MAG: hypothetical protein CMJ64_11120 [Planctomycetaceae bacterium]|nr:hypothetical protein [Planctomycetaceae bacterium]
MSAVTLEGPVGKKKAYRVRWRYNGQRPRKSLGTVTASEAKRRRDEIAETLRLLESGRLEIPAGIDATEFVFSAGRIEQARVASRQTLQAAIDAYLATRKGRITKETYEEYERRLNAVRDRLGGSDRVIDSISIHDLQQYVERRQQQVSGGSVKRDLTRFFDMYKLAAANGWISRPLDREQVMTILRPTIRRDKKKPDWRTYGETVREVERRNLTEDRQKELWKRAYFDANELGRFLNDLKDSARTAPGFVHPMVVTATFTGARRSELCRLEIEDVDLDGGAITFRQRKLKQKLCELHLDVGHYFGAIHFKPVPKHDDWFHVHAIFECSQACSSHISEQWPHGITIAGQPGISPRVAANYMTHYAVNPENGWPNWFRQKRFKRFYNSKCINSLDPRFVPRKRSASANTRSVPGIRRRRRDVDTQIASCGTGATIAVERDGERGGTVQLCIGDVPG